jgi:hypothetical protein
LPPLSTSLNQAQLRQEYRAERRIEMAFEEQRFFDVRRWMIAPAVLSKDAFGIDISLSGANRTDRSTWTGYQYRSRSIQGRTWNDRLYFMPIHADEMNRNSLLKQNPGY